MCCLYSIKYIFQAIEQEHMRSGEQMLRSPVEILSMYNDMKITVEVLDKKWKIQETSKKPQIVPANYLWHTRPTKTFLLIRGNSLLKARVLLSQKSNDIDPVLVNCVVNTTSKQTLGISKDINEGASLGNLWHPNSKTYDNFRILKANLGKCFGGEKCCWIRFLLFNKLDVGEITNQDFNANDLLNELEDKGLISPTNVNLLLEVTKTSEIAQAKDLVSKYITDNKVENKHTGKTKLSPYRKRLFKALKQVDQDALRNVTSFYELRRYNFSNVWNAVLHLEMNGRLTDDPDKIQTFADCVGGMAGNMLNTFNVLTEPFPS
ncbi:uncharacterized protein [Antedon mediterranea]|uniref:uncharacterized protein n=1 Tax=Antedon mediterranea TaxID=105859 RepID=UPI003AF5B3B1